MRPRHGSCIVKVTKKRLPHRSRVLPLNQQLGQMTPAKSYRRSLDIQILDIQFDALLSKPLDHFMKALLAMIVNPFQKTGQLLVLLSKKVAEQVKGLAAKLAG